MPAWCLSFLPAFTTAWTLLVAVRRIALHQRVPFADVLLLNGPGTCVPLVLAVWAARVRRCSILDLPMFQD